MKVIHRLALAVFCWVDSMSYFGRLERVGACGLCKNDVIIKRMPLRVKFVVVIIARRGEAA
jgi:hypothetical protein